MPEWLDEILKNDWPASGCPGRFRLVQAQADDLDAPEMELIRAHLQTCRACKTTWDSLETRRQQYLRDHPPEVFVARVKQLIEEKRLHRRRWFLVLAPAAAALAALLVALVLWLPGGDRGGVRTKGAEAALRFYVLRDNGAEPGISGGIQRAGDRIQFVTASPHRYVFLLSLDDRGRVSNFNPGEQVSSVSVTPGSRQVQDGSVELDDSVAPERVFAVFSDEPLAFEEVEAAALRAYARIKASGKTVRDLESLPLDLPQASVLLLKDAGLTPR